VLSVNDLQVVGRSVLWGDSLPAALARVHRTKGAFISGLGYSKDQDTRAVGQVYDIIDWINRSAEKMTILDEKGLGIEAALRGGKLSESAIIRFKQSGDRFVDEPWGVTSEWLGYMGRPSNSGIS